MKTLESTKVFLLCKSKSDNPELSDLAMLIPTNYRALKAEHEFTKELYENRQEEHFPEDKVVTFEEFQERKTIKTKKKIEKERSERLFKAIFED